MHICYNQGWVVSGIDLHNTKFELGLVQYTISYKEDLLELPTYY